MSYRNAVAAWVPWSNTWTAYTQEGPPEPMITDIVFYANGGMILGLTDRRSNTHGWFNNTPMNTFPGSYGDLAINQGDVVRFDPVVDGGGNCTYQLVTAGATGEFYQDNYWHTESSIGALAMVPGGGDVVATFMDPVQIYSFGLAWYNNTTGARNRTAEVGYSGTGAATFGKANGLGDLEVAAASPDIEIGNLVWNDTDGDGIQDGGETGIASVPVELYDMTGTTLLATTNTNTTGNYYFNKSNVTDGDTSTLGNQPGLKPHTNYIVCIGTSAFTGGIGTGTLAGKLLTLPSKRVTEPPAFLTATPSSRAGRPASR